LPVTVAKLLPDSQTRCSRNAARLHAGGVSAAAGLAVGQKLRHGNRQRRRRSSRAAVAFAGYRGEAFARQPDPLQQKRRQREAQQDHRQLIPWGLFTLVIYGMIMIGGFVQSWGLNNALTLDHYALFSPHDCTKPPIMIMP
jgi:hypothetical protein